MIWTNNVTNKTSRMVVGPGGKFMNTVMWETGVDISMVPLSGAGYGPRLSGPE